VQFRETLPLRAGVVVMTKDADVVDLLDRHGKANMAHDSADARPGRSPGRAP
jgi:hypothetical protein